LDPETFVTDRRTFDAVVRNLEIMGEATKNLPAAVRERHPEVRWRGIAGFRDIAAHFYFGLKQEIVISIVYEELPNLVGALTAVLESEGARPWPPGAKGPPE
jgi:uncharacterized protein with HEPN domain